MAKQIYDIAIVGGGINGTGIAADAAGRGLSVLLCEQNDLAQATSSASSKLIHGGIRYLENLHFRLVRESLNERELLLHKAPHLVHPIRFIMPTAPKIRSSFLIAIGLFLYDHLAKKLSLPKSQFISLDSLIKQDRLQPFLKRAFCYSDCVVDDSRLVLANALAAKNYGADILNYTQCTGARRENNVWRVMLKDHNHQQKDILAKALVNATGPWTEIFMHHLGMSPNNKILLVKGSHILIPKIYDSYHAYLLQHEDKRVVFVIPYLDNYTLIGTTDVTYQGNPADIAISSQEIDYLCQITNRYFTIDLKPKDIIYSYSGVRPLKGDAKDNPAKVSREYTIELSDEHNLPLLSVIGGKITTYRKLAETAVERLRNYFPAMQSAWTAHTPLPGGDIADINFTAFLEKIFAQYPKLEKSLLTRYAKQYGTLMHTFLNDVTSTADLGYDFGCGLFARELSYLVNNEWVRTAEDVLWRRTKLGYIFPQNNIANLNNQIQKLLSKAE